ncbi:cell division protein CrgA [Ilumatobacter sp.]|uniref:cell division protein CrgA n=1 Tax=Ilumatobacter sp. TaxID=1967498 RepID=UPI003B5198A3
MAPPKRKTGGGRVTPKGTRPGERAAGPSSSSDEPASRTSPAASSRYTPRRSRRQLVPPNWIPVIMLVLLVGGGLVIMARYLVWSSSNIPTLIGLAMIMGGLFAATKWE